MRSRARLFSKHINRRPRKIIFRGRFHTRAHGLRQQGAPGKISHWFGEPFLWRFPQCRCSFCH